MRTLTRQQQNKTSLDNSKAIHAKLPVGWVDNNGILTIKIDSPESGKEEEETKQPKRSRKHFVYYPLFLLRVTLRIVGVVPYKYNNIKEEYEFKWCSLPAIHTLITFAWLCVLVVTTTIGISRLFLSPNVLGNPRSHEMELMAVIIIVGCLLNAWIEVFNLLYNREDLCNFINGLDKLHKTTALDLTRGMKKNATILVMFLFTFILLMLLAGVFGGESMQGIVDGLTRVLLLIPQEFLSKETVEVQIIHVMMGIAIGHLFTVYKGALFFFVIICHMLQNALCGWRKELAHTLDVIWEKEESKPTSGSSNRSSSGKKDDANGQNGMAYVGLDKLVQHHWEVVKTVRETEKLFASTLQCFYATQVVTLCLELYLVAYRVSIGEDYRPDEIAWQTIIITQTFFVFFLVSIKASYVYEEAEASVDVLRRGLPYTACARDKFHFNELVTSLTSSSICITGGRFFYINRPFIITVVGAVLSYFIIVLQLMLPSAARERAAKANNISLPV